MKAKQGTAVQPHTLYTCEHGLCERPGSLYVYVCMLGDRGAQVREFVLRHLTRQRTLGGEQLAESRSVRRQFAQVCGEWVRLEPAFLALAQRLHRLFFLHGHASPTALLLEDLGRAKYHPVVPHPMATLFPSRTSSRFFACSPRAYVCLFAP